MQRTTTPRLEADAQAPDGGREAGPAALCANRPCGAHHPCRIPPPGPPSPVLPSPVSPSAVSPSAASALLCRPLLCLLCCSLLCRPLLCRPLLSPSAVSAGLSCAGLPQPLPPRQSLGPPSALTHTSPLQPTGQMWPSRRARSASLMTPSPVSPLAGPLVRCTMRRKVFWVGVPAPCCIAPLLACCDARDMHKNSVLLPAACFWC